MNLSATEIAQKQRHLYLLTRIRNNQPLSRPELAELEELEKTMIDKKATSSKRQVTTPSRAEVAAADVIENEAAAALYTGRSTRTIRRWRNEGMLTAVKDGKPVYLRSQLKLFAENEGRKPTKTKLKKEEAEAGIKQTRDEREKIELEILKGEWVRKEDINKDNVRKVLTVKSGIFALVRTIIAAVPAESRRQIQRIANKEARRIIEGFIN